MAKIRPFAGIRYNDTLKRQLDKLIAPPYDVLDEAGKAALQARHERNIVTVDLPYLPPKAVGPDEVYAAANNTLQQWLNDGTLVRDTKPCLYPYIQRYTHNGHTYSRRGLIGLVRLTPFGQDVIPHEKTYRGAIEDRLKLMQHTRVQLSPIFGLFSDPENNVNDLLFREAGAPLCRATLDGVENELWRVDDPAVIGQVQAMFTAKKIYIADGHHRYTTALEYQRLARESGPLPDDHPANYCMFVLVGMQDPGLLILPTHRLIGGLDGFDPEAFRQALGDNFDFSETPLEKGQVHELAATLPTYPPNSFGLYDGTTGKTYTLVLKNRDLLKPLEPDKSDAWRSLDVAILQRYLIEEVLQPKFASGREVVKGYTADDLSVASMTDGRKFQIALILNPTPLQALEDLGRHGELMPQKSTFFYPKLATGLVIAPL